MDEVMKLRSMWAGSLTGAPVHVNMVLLAASGQIAESSRSDKLHRLKSLRVLKFHIIIFTCARTHGTAPRRRTGH